MPDLWVSRKGAISAKLGGVYVP